MSESSSTTADAATGMSTNAFLEARRPTLARRLLSLLFSVYGIVWTVICMIPVIVAIYLILHCASHLHDLEGLVLILDDILTPATRYAGLIVLHSMSAVVFKRSGSLAASVLAMLVEITCQVVFIAFNWQLWNEIYLALQAFVMSFF